MILRLTRRFRQDGCGFQDASDSGDKHRDGMNITRQKYLNPYAMICAAISGIVLIVGACELHGQELADRVELDDGAKYLIASHPKMSEPDLKETGQVVTAKSYFNTVPVHVDGKDEVWVVSGRRALETQKGQLDVSKLVNGNWQPSTLEHLLKAHSTDTGLSTMLFVHGNRYDIEACKSGGLLFYQSIFKANSNRRPVRLVLFSWKAERERIRPVHDFNIKSRRALEIGDVLGRLLGKFRSQELAICSYSLGAQIIVKALEHRDATSAETTRRSDTTNQRKQVRVAMMAPAFDPVYSCSQLYSFPNNKQVDKTDVFYNEGDLVIRGAELLARKRCRDGTSVLAKLSQNQNPRAANPVQLHNVTDELSTSHSLLNYIKSPTIQNRLCEMLGSTRDAKPDEQGGGRGLELSNAQSSRRNVQSLSSVMPSPSRGVIAELIEPIQVQQPTATSTR